MYPSNSDVVGLDRKAGQDRLYPDCPCLAVRFVGAFHANQKVHRGDCRDDGVVNAEYAIHVERAALKGDEDAGVEDNSPGHA